LQFLDKKVSSKMAFRLLNDDLFFRHPLDVLYHDDDFYWEPLSLLTDVQRRRRASQAQKQQERLEGGAQGAAEESGNPEVDQGKKQQQQVTAAAPIHALSTTSMHPGRLLSPIMNTDLIESERDFMVHIDLPGVEPKDLEVSVTDKFLVIKAERKHSHEEKTDKVHSMERSFGTVQRRIRMPNTADLELAKTSFKHGVLSITVPKKVEMKPASRKLEIETA
jgi:HSP20 family protein